MQFEPKFRTIVNLFEDSVAKFGDRLLFGSRVDGKWKWLTYAEFGQEVDAFRGGLHSLGVGRGDRVAVISANRVEWATAGFASLTLGAVFVPMYEAQLEKDWEFIVKDSGARVLIVSTNEIYERVKHFPDKIEGLRPVVCMQATESHAFARLLEQGRSQPAPVVQPNPEEIAYLIYTSGTTGQPKGVLLGHDNIASNVSALHQVFDLGKDDRSLSFLPWAHSFGLTCEMHTLLSMGASIGINTSVDKLIDELSEVRPTVLISVPRIFNRIYDRVQSQMDSKPAALRKLFEAGRHAASKRRLGKPLSLGDRLALTTADALVFSKIRKRFGGRLRYAVSGGASLAKEVGEFIDDLGITVYEGYGLTETSPVTNVNFPENRRMGSVGKPLPGCAIEIDRSVTQDPLQGEIIAYGPNVMKGYHNRPQETAEVLADDGGFRTGDIGYVDDDGYLFVTGRLKEQYKLENGKYVVPSPLEEALKLSRFVLNAFIYGDNRPFNVALIVPDLSVLGPWAAAEGIESSTPELLFRDARVIDKIRAELDTASRGFKGYERIDRFLLISEDFTTENGMLTPSLKLKRRAVLAKWGNTIEALYTTG